MTKYSMGLYVLYFGTTRQYPNIAHHTIWLGKRFKGLLRDILTEVNLLKIFLYTFTGPRNRPKLCPRGCDSFYVLCPVPNLKSELNWKLKAKIERRHCVSSFKDYPSEPRRTHHRRLLDGSHGFSKQLPIPSWSRLLDSPHISAIGMVPISEPRPKIKFVFRRCWYPSRRRITRRGELGEGGRENVERKP